MDDSSPTAYVFEGFRLDRARRRLLGADGQALPLSARAYDVLAFLVENRARVVSKDELMRAVWSRVVVEENNLNQAIYNIRKALGDTRQEPRFILTVAGRGYQFIADTHAERGTDAMTPSAPPPAAPQPEPLPVTAEPATAHSRRWLLLAGGAAVASLAGAAWWLKGRSPAGGLPPSVAVLPFRPVVEPDPNAAIGIGITETLINRLSELPGVAVSPLSSVRRFAGPDVDPLAAGRELRVAAVLEGNVQLEHDRLRLTWRLLDVENGRALWSGRFDEQLD